MVKDTLNSIFDNLKERTTNPFLGTFVVVWIVKNWTLVYSLFYFDEGLNLKSRLAYISDYFSTHSFFWNMIFVILITLGVLTLTYFFLAISRLLTDVYDRIVIPKLSKWTDSSSIVLKEDYIKLEEIIRQLEVRLDEERSAKIEVQNERDRLDVKLIELKDSFSNQSPSEIKQQTEPSVANATELDFGFDRVATKVKKDWDKEQFNELINSILNGVYIRPDNKMIKILLREGFISLDSQSDEVNRYSFTPEGVLFLKHWNKVSFNEVSD